MTSTSHGRSDIQLPQPMELKPLGDSALSEQPRSISAIQAPRPNTHQLTPLSASIRPHCTNHSPQRSKTRNRNQAEENTTATCSAISPLSIAYPWTSTDIAVMDTIISIDVSCAGTRRINLIGREAKVGTGA